jgi:hypothetical protein
MTKPIWVGMGGKTSSRRTAQRYTEQEVGSAQLCEAVAAANRSTQ